MGSLLRPSGAERAGTAHLERTAPPCEAGYQEEM